ncbi:hypothetical protein MMC16_003464 [Acarospora aff. strigata]|nr:hypothetical protein [Acarospora aff. strigata]
MNSYVELFAEELQEKLKLTESTPEDHHACPDTNSNQEQSAPDASTGEARDQPVEGLWKADYYRPRYDAETRAPRRSHTVSRPDDHYAGIRKPRNRPLPNARRAPAMKPSAANSSSIGATMQGNAPPPPTTTSATSSWSTPVPRVPTSHADGRITRLRRQLRYQESLLRHLKAEQTEGLRMKNQNPDYMVRKVRGAERTYADMQARLGRVQGLTGGKKGKGSGATLERKERGGDGEGLSAGTDGFEASLDTCTL